MEENTDSPSASRAGVILLLKQLHRKQVMQGIDALRNALHTSRDILKVDRSNLASILIRTSGGGPLCPCDSETDGFR
jgi:hypothetical protein